MPELERLVSTQVHGPFFEFISAGTQIELQIPWIPLSDPNFSVSTVFSQRLPVPAYTEDAAERPCRIGTNEERRPPTLLFARRFIA